jgi:hypothetical protein
MVSTISTYEQELRNLINAPRRHWLLRRDPHRFNQVCSALDVIGDTEMALDAYLSKEHQHASTGQRYLDIYGVLQVLVVQQDAVEHSAQALGIEYKPDPQLREIRETRNDSVGHPTRRGEPPGRAFNFIAQVSMSWKGFQLGTATPQRDLRVKQVGLPELIGKQREVLASALARVVELVVREEADHRQRFRAQPLASAFPYTLGYAMEKLAEEIRGDRALGMGSWYVQRFHDAVTGFEQRLIERQELPPIQDAFDYHAGPARHALVRLDEFFAGAAPYLTADDAEVFRAYLQMHIEGLEALAREIDEEYAKDPETSAA